jgi:membrane protease YdiL (CAAX protease family)
MALGPDYAAAPPPPPPPVDSSGYPRWPLWLPLAALGAGLSAGFVLVALLAGVLSAAGVHTDGGKAPGFTVAATLLLDVSVVGASVLLAGVVTRPRPWHFGLRGGSLAFTAKIASIGVLAYFLFDLVYAAVVQPKNPQKVVQDLGADKSTLLLVTGALVVIVVAPVCEELFFRGFLFRVLRTRMPLWVAALIDGILFGVVHGELVIVPILTALGMVLCWVYERTGTLFAPIALHALNNTISYGVTTDNGWGAALAIGGVVLAGCVVGIVRVPRGAPAGGPAPAAAT